MKEYKFNLQRFAETEETEETAASTAPEGLTVNGDIATKVREIDFVTQFGKNMQALLDVMSITRPIRKANGTQLKTKKAVRKSTKLEGGATVGEGELIPLTEYKVTETVYDSITLEKYAKAVSLEAIAEKGYEAAVDMTNAEFQSDLQNVVMDKFYTMLKSGTLTANATTFQAGIATAIGKVKEKFMSMHRTATGAAVWVNIMDVYNYLGTAAVTIQNAFGLEYIKDFLGADIVFLTSEVASGTIIATPVNNIVCYYVDPADSEFARAGLSFTTDPATGYIGFHENADYDHMIVKQYALSGIRLFAEYLDGIAKVTVSAS